MGGAKKLAKHSEEMRTIVTKRISQDEFLQSNWREQPRG